MWLDESVYSATVSDIPFSCLKKSPLKNCSAGESFPLGRVTPVCRPKGKELERQQECSFKRYSSTTWGADEIAVKDLFPGWGIFFPSQVTFALNKGVTWMWPGQMVVGTSGSAQSGGGRGGRAVRGAGAAAAAAGVRRVGARQPREAAASVRPGGPLSAKGWVVVTRQRTWLCLQSKHSSRELQCAGGQCA